MSQLNSVLRRKKNPYFVNFVFVCVPSQQHAVSRSSSQIASNLNLFLLNKRHFKKNILQDIFLYINTRDYIRNEMFYSYMGIDYLCSYTATISQLSLPTKILIKSFFGRKSTHVMLVFNMHH